MKNSLYFTHLKFYFVTVKRIPTDDVIAVFRCIVVGGDVECVSGGVEGVSGGVEGVSGGVEGVGHH
jgi:hypothetical protein